MEGLDYHGAFCSHFLISNGFTGCSYLAKQRFFLLKRHMNLFLITQRQSQAT